MPINMSIEYPKLKNELTVLRQQNKELLEALKMICKVSLNTTVRIIAQKAISKFETTT